MEAPLEGLDRILGGGLTSDMYTNRRNSKLEAIKRAKTRKMMSLGCETCIAAGGKKHLSTS